MCNVVTWFVRGVFLLQLALAVQAAYVVGGVDGWRFAVGAAAVGSMFLSAYTVARIAWREMVLI